MQPSKSQTLILASSSPYRKKQLENLKVDFKFCSPRINEKKEKENLKKTLTKKGGRSKIYSQKLALSKALSLKNFFPNSIIIGGDQIVEFKDKILEKPLTPKKALEQLQMLSNQTHKLVTSLCVLSEKKQFIHTEVAHLKMRKLSIEDIKLYLKDDKPFDSCGSYKLEKSGFKLFRKIQCEDPSSLIGLPLISLIRALSKLKVNLFYCK